MIIKTQTDARACIRTHTSMHIASLIDAGRARASKPQARAALRAENTQHDRGARGGDMLVIHAAPREALDVREHHVDGHLKYRDDVSYQELAS